MPGLISKSTTRRNWIVSATERPSHLVFLYHMFLSHPLGGFSCDGEMRVPNQSPIDFISISMPDFIPRTSLKRNGIIITVLFPS